MQLSHDDNLTSRYVFLYALITFTSGLQMQNELAMDFQDTTNMEHMDKLMIGNYVLESETWVDKWECNAAS